MKKIIKFLNYNLFLLLLFLLIFSFYGKSIINNYVNNCIKEIYINNNVDTENNIFTSEEFNQIMDDDSTNELINKFVDYTLKSVSGEDIEFNTSEEIIEFLKNNKQILEEEYNIEIGYKDIDNLKSNETFNEIIEQYDDSVIKVKNELNDNDKKIIKIFNIICSSYFKIIVLIILILDLIIYSLCNKSLYKWCKLLGVDLFICSVFNMILSFIIKYIFDSKFTVLFDNSLIIEIAIIGFIIGIVLIVIYNLLNKKKEDNNEIFEEYKEK